MIIFPKEMLVTKIYHIYNIIWVTQWNFVGDIKDRNYDFIAFISKYLYFKKAYSSHFYWHHQNCNHVYLKKVSKMTQKKLK